MALAPRDPYYPWRKYADPKPMGKGWTYTDTSKFYKNKIRFSFMRGQQLWDDDWTNNFNWWGLWLGMWAFYRRDINTNQKPPYHSKNISRSIWDVQHSNPAPKHADFIEYTLLTSGTQYWYQPTYGARAWVEADRMYVCYTPDGWKPVARLRDRQWDVEIAIFACGGKPGEIVAVKKIDQGFRIYRETNASRGRGFSERPYNILRNGVKVGQVAMGKYAANVSFTGEYVDFQTGDVLALQAHVTTASKYVALSLVGTRI